MAKRKFELSELIEQHDSKRDALWQRLVFDVRELFGGITLDEALAKINAHYEE